MLPFIVFSKSMFISWNDQLTAKWQSDQVDTKEGVTYMFRQKQHRLAIYTYSLKPKKKSKLMYRQHEAEKRPIQCVPSTRNWDLVF